MVAKLVRAIWKGLIKFDKPEEETNVYLLWAGDSTSDQKNKQLTYIPPPKRKLPGEFFFADQICFHLSGNCIFESFLQFGFPGHEESYNPCLEFIPTEEEKASYKLMPEEDQPKLIPQRYVKVVLYILSCSFLWDLLA